MILYVAGFETYHAEDRPVEVAREPAMQIVHQNGTVVVAHYDVPDGTTWDFWQDDGMLCYMAVFP